MKKILATCLFLGLFMFSGNAQEFKFGAQGQLLFDGSFFGVGGKGHYTFNDQFAGQASFTYYFEEVTVWTLDLDVHYSGFEIGDVESFRLTPFAGLNIFNVSVDTGFGSASASTTNLNLGMNGTMPLGDSLEFFLEPKIIIGSGGTFALAAGVYF